MSLRIASAAGVWDRLAGEGVEYAVLREDPHDVDLLIRDEAVTAARALLGASRARRGVKIDLYGVGGAHGTGYHGFAHLPEALGERVLERRVRRDDGAFEAHPRDRFLADAYHAVYHKAQQCGLDWRDPSASRPGRMASLARAESVAPTLRDLHNRLVDSGFAVTPDRLAAYVRHDFRHGRKVYFHARLMNQLPGELNLFVIRAAAARHGLTEDLLARLESTYRVLAVKAVPWLRRLRTRSRMRGGKWRRGGMPCVAVVVFDPDPLPPSAEQRRVHPHVFNARQFLKPEWREWFIDRSGARASTNPIHSTDNEAEAIGHLPLFFDDEEQAAIRERLRRERGSVPESFGPDAYDPTLD